MDNLTERGEKTIIQSSAYKDTSTALQLEIADLLNQIWPENPPLAKKDSPKTHHPAFNAQSFYLRLNDKIMSYAAVLQKTIQHNTHTFHIAGLSCVATAPRYRGQGFGLRTVAAATNWVEQQKHFDFGIFTCHPSLASFYKQGGGWEIAPNMILVGNDQPGAISSIDLDVVVLIRFFSKKAKQSQLDLHNTTIHLDFPVGEFL